MVQQGRRISQVTFRRCGHFGGLKKGYEHIPVQTVGGFDTLGPTGSRIQYGHLIARPRTIFFDMSYWCMQVNVTEGRFLAAQYDKPTTLFHRHNEVWFVPLPKNTSEASLAMLWEDAGLVTPLLAEVD